MRRERISQIREKMMLSTINAERKSERIKVIFDMMLRRISIAAKHTEKPIAITAIACMDFVFSTQNELSSPILVATRQKAISSA